MFQLRLGLTVVLILATGALALVAGTTALTEQVLDPFDTVAGHAAAAVNGQLVRHGSDAVDAAMRAAVDESVRAAVKKGAMSPEAEAALLARAGGNGAPAFAAFVKPDGTVAGRAGADLKLEPNIVGMPVIAEARTGVARDGGVVIDGQSVHVAAAPVYEGAELAGVVLLGWFYDAAFVDELARAADAAAVLLVGDKRLGAAVPQLTVAELRETQSFGALDLGSIPQFLPVLIPDRGRYVATGIPVFAGDDALRLVVVTDRNPAMRAIATAQGLVLVGTLGLALLQLIITLSVLRSVRKPIDTIMDHLAQFQQGGTVGILPEANLSGPFLRLGKQVNMILQMTPSASRPGSLGSLSGMTGSLPPALGNFPPPADPVDARAPIAPPSPASAPPLGDFRVPASTPNPAPMLAALAADSGPSQPAPVAPAGAPSGLASLFDDGPDPLAAFRVPAPAAAPPMPTPPPPPMHEPPLAPMQPEATLMFQVPQELIKQSAQQSPAPVQAYIPPAHQVDDARTVVAQVPQELLSQVVPKGDVAAGDEAHYREVYDKFVETRIQCGEDTSDLTYDRFVQKLLKNRQQIVEKHKAKSVRFQVYVKEGKAALRALPVREP